MFVAVGIGSANSFAYSYDGINWVGVGKPVFSVNAFGIAWGNNLWVANGEGGNTLASSPDGINWTGRGSTIQNNSWKAAWNGALWVAVGQGAATSPDGINWTSRTIGGLTTGQSVTWNGNLWVVATEGTTKLSTSLDGITWTSRVTSTDLFAFGGYAIASRRVLPYVGSTVTPPSTSLVINEVSGTSQTLSSSNWNQYFYLTNSGFNALTLPSSTVATSRGRFWTLRNATTSNLSITLTNTLTLTSPLVVPPSTAVTLAISGSASNTILLL
jgi:hypothetical protein